MTSDIFIIAGESSGDLHGSGLIKAARAAAPEVCFHGIGGPQMVSAGLHQLFPSSDLAVVGIVEVLSHLGPILKAYRRTVNWLRRHRPALVVLIDYPDFNFLVAKQAKKLNIPVFYYITPQVWAWRRGRVRKLKRYTDRLGVILPFEEPFFRKHGVDAVFVGHPLLDVVKADMSRTEFCASAGMDPGRPIVGLLPGSRSGEVARHFPLMAEAASELSKTMPDVQFMLVPAPSLDLEKSVVSTEIGRPGSNGVTVVRECNYEAMAAADVLLTASGTVTLEAAILETPMVVTYRVSPVTYFLGRPFIKVPYVSLVNLVAGREVVPEILQEDATPKRLAHTLLSIMEDSKKATEMKRSLASVRKALGAPGASARAAKLALELLAEGQGS